MPFSKSYSLFLSAILLIATFISPDPVHSQDNDELKILSWNVWLFPNAIAVGKWQGNPVKRVPHIINALNSTEVDVIVLSEAFSKKRRNWILDDIRDNYPHQSDVLSSGFGSRINGGVVIASKWPIERREEIVFDNGISTDASARKGALYVRIMKGDTPYHIIGTHTQATASANWSEFAQVRQDQFRSIRSFINSLNIPRDEALIMSGDLNVDFYRSGEYQRMLDLLGARSPDWRNLDQRPATYDETSNHLLADKGNLRELLDYTLYSSTNRRPSYAHNQVRRFTAPGGLDGDPNRPDISDHYAVEGFYRFGESSECVTQAMTPLQPVSKGKTAQSGARVPGKTQSGPNIQSETEAPMTGSEARRLCASASTRPGPAICFQTVMATFDWIAEGSERKDFALDFCRGNVFPRQRIRCYEQYRADGAKEAEDWCTP